MCFFFSLKIVNFCGVGLVLKCYKRIVRGIQWKIYRRELVKLAMANIFLSTRCFYFNLFSFSPHAEHHNLLCFLFTTTWWIRPRRLCCLNVKTMKRMKNNFFIVRLIEQGERISFFHFLLSYFFLLFLFYEHLPNTNE